MPKCLASAFEIPIRLRDVIEHYPQPPETPPHEFTALEISDVEGKQLERFLRTLGEASGAEARWLAAPPPGLA